MTGDRATHWGPLAWRLLAAFVVVALSSVAVLTAAALLGTSRGLATAETADRARLAAEVAELAGAAYLRAGGWPAANLQDAGAVAAVGGAHLLVQDGSGSVVAGHGPGRRAGMGAATGARLDAPVIVDGTEVGTVTLAFPAAAGTAARRIAWAWIALAALIALVVATVVSWLVSRRIAGPLTRLTAAARAIAAGDHTARSGAATAPGELGELAGAFDTMADRVTQAEAARRLLTADVAHQLRTPLAAVQAGLEELRDGLVPADTPRLTSLHDQTLRLGRVVDDLAELAAAETAALSLRPVELDLAELAGGVVRAHAAQLRAGGLEIRTQLAGGVVVRADPDRLHQAIGNLLDNAARYGGQGGQVTVAVRAEGGLAAIEVSDTGPGIPADELPHVFDRLWRGRAAAVVSGSGIGLAVVHELVTAHGGTVTAGAGPAGGTAFTIRLPASTVRPSASPIRPSRGRGTGGSP